MMKQGRPKPGQRRRTRRESRIAAVAALVIVIALAIGYFAFRAHAALPGVSMPDQGNRHVTSVDEPHERYNSDPPTSGPHLPYIAPWGVHSRPIPRELQVHNLEDGGVLVQYNCECPELIAKLRAIVERYDTQVILAPYPTMKSRIALTAWTRIDTMETFDEGRIVRFVDAYRSHDHHPR